MIEILQYTDSMVENDVNQTTNPEKPPETQEITQPETIGNFPIKKKKTWLIVILITFLIISYGAIGIFAYTNYLLKNQIQPKENILTATPSSTPTPTPAQLEYGSEKLGYSFDYPSDWELKNSEGDNPYTTVTSLNSGLIQFWKNPLDQGMECVEEISKEKILLGGLTADKTVQKEISDGDICSGNSKDPYMFIVITTTKNNNYYLITARWKPKTETNFEYYFDKVISSFKFLD